MKKSRKLHFIHNRILGPTRGKSSPPEDDENLMEDDDDETDTESEEDDASTSSSSTAVASNGVVLKKKSKKRSRSGSEKGSRRNTSKSAGQLPPHHKSGKKHTLTGLEWPSTGALCDRLMRLLDAGCKVIQVSNLTGAPPPRRAALQAAKRQRLMAGEYYAKTGGGKGDPGVSQCFHLFLLVCLSLFLLHLWPSHASTKLCTAFRRLSDRVASVTAIDGRRVLCENRWRQRSVGG